jgi:hypothetical protein
VSTPESSSEGSVPEDTSCGVQLREGEQIPGSLSEVLHSPSGKVLDAIGP